MLAVDALLSVVGGVELRQVGVVAGVSLAETHWLLDRAGLVILDTNVIDIHLLSAFLKVVITIKNNDCQNIRVYTYLNLFILELF